jgi:hypothetical protein
MRRVASIALSSSVLLAFAAAPATAATASVRWGVAPAPAPAAAAPQLPHGVSGRAPSGWGGYTTKHKGGFGVTVPRGAVSNTATSGGYTTDGTVYASVTSRGVVYLGGRFTHLVSPTGVLTPAAHVAALDAATGLPVPGFSATIDDGDVLALAVSPDGGRVYAGGTFTHSSTVYAGHVIALDPATGARDGSWHGSTTFQVRSLVTGRTQVFAGGGFGSIVPGATSTYLASLDAATGSATAGWTPALIDNEPYHTQAPANTDGWISALALSADGTRLFVGGYFNQVGGATHPSLVALSTATGALITGFHPGDLIGGSAHLGDDVLALVSTPTHLYVGVGGPRNQLYDYSPSTGGTPRFHNSADGDIQALALVGTRLYIGGHFHDYVQDARGYHYNGMTVYGSVVDITFTARIDTTTGLLDTTWHPAMGNWQDPGAYFGTYAISSDGRNLSAGGAFDQVNGAPRLHLAFFAAR